MLSPGFVAVTASSGAVGPLVPRKASHTNDFDYPRRAKRNPCRAAVLLRLPSGSTPGLMQDKEAYLFCISP